MTEISPPERGAITLNYGFTNAVWAIISVSVLIFLTGLPISYYAAKHGLDGEATRSRMVAEAALRFGSTEAVYDGTSGAFSRTSARRSSARSGRTSASWTTSRWCG